MKGKRSNWFAIGLLGAGFLVVVVLFGLNLLGPAVGNIVGNVVANFRTSDQVSQQGAPIDSIDPQAERASGGVSALPTALSIPHEPPAAEVVQSVVASTSVTAMPTASPAGMATPPDAMTFEDYGVNPFYDTADDKFSTFAMDVDTASYTIARNYLQNYGQLPASDAIRPEEFVNYFDADYVPPTGDDAFAIHLDAAPAPFGYENHYLLRVGIQGRYVATEDREPMLLVFVIDVSGSMDREDRLGTVKDSLVYLVDELREDDRVGIVVYSDFSRAVLDPIPASEKAQIIAVIDSLNTEGSTNAEDGLRLGYQMAQSYMGEGQAARIILCSDGVANVGSTGPDEILKTIRAGVEKGIGLTTVGFGMGNYNDVLMEQLANDGNGSYYYVDTLREARRIFVHNLTGTLQVIGYNAKIQVEFNPEVTDRYRLIGYENRAIADQDFRNDTVDAGEVGAGHSVTALYEIALEDDVAQVVSANDIIATAYIRYEDAETREIVEQQADISVEDLQETISTMPPSFRVQVAAAEFAELLRGSTWAEDGSYSAVLKLLEPVVTERPDDEYVGELVALVRAAIHYGDQ